MNTQMRTLAQRARNAPGLAEKASAIREMGDARYDQYKATSDPKERQLAINCYLGARELVWKNSPAYVAPGTGIRY